MDTILIKTGKVNIILFGVGVTDLLTSHLPSHIPSTLSPGEMFVLYTTPFFPKPFQLCFLRSPSIVPSWSLGLKSGQIPLAVLVVAVSSVWLLQ